MNKNKSIIRDRPIALLVMTMIMMVVALVLSGCSMDQVDNAKDPNNVYVIDSSRVLSKSTKDEIKSRNMDWEKTSRKIQLLVITVSGIPNDESMENYAADLFKKYGPGDKSKDSGLLLLIDTKDHKDRLEVGYGLEDLITDSRAKYVLDSGKSKLHDEDYDSGVKIMMDSINGIITGKITDEEVRSKNNRWDSDKIMKVVFVIIIAIIFGIPIGLFLLYSIFQIILWPIAKIIKLIRPLGSTRIGGWADGFKAFDNVEDVLEWLPIMSFGGGYDGGSSGSLGGGSSGGGGASGSF